MDDGLDHLAHVARGEPVLLSPRLDPGKIEDVVDQAGQTPALAFDVLAVLLTFSGSCARPKRNSSPRTRIDATGVRSSCDTLDTNSGFHLGEPHRAVGGA